MPQKTPMKKAAPVKTSGKKSPAKKAIKKQAVKAESKEPSLQILATSKCKTISGKSNLTYNIAVDDKDSIHIRVNGNDGGGFWSKEWVSFDHIESVLSDVPDNQAITSIHLFPLFKGKSVNTPGYLLAVLRNEKLLESFQGKKRQYAYMGLFYG